MVVAITLMLAPPVGLQILSRELGARTPGAPEGGILYFVNTTSDVVVIGACENGNDGCSLRGAIQAANSHPGDDGIEFSIPPSDPNCLSGGFCIVQLTQALPDLSTNMSITGPSSNTAGVERQSGAAYRIFNVTATGSVTISGLLIDNAGSNSAPNGGSIQNAGSATVNVTNCRLFSGAAQGGSIFNASGGTVNVTNSLVGGSAGNGGGSIFNASGGTVNVTNSTVSGFSHSGGGGGIYNNSTGTVNVLNSTLSSNTALGGPGGGIYNNGSGTVKVTNSTLANNSSSSGGGIFNNTTGAVTIANCTIAKNTAPDGGGGVHNAGGTVNVKSSIVALNLGGPSDATGAFISGGFNLIGRKDGSTGFTVSTDQTGTTASPLDPKFDQGGLKDNGGSTLTFALRFGSPALDKGSGEVQPGLFLVNDQRGAGFTRTVDDPSVPNATGGDGTDIGSFEVQTVAPTVLANISTRLRVETGDNVMIGGFIISGAEAERIIVRAIGPSLPLAGKLADPVLELHNSSGALLESNDNWRSQHEADIIATGIPPSNDLESAVVRGLLANNSAYSAIVRGVNGGTGIGLVEAYDLNEAIDSRLANISTRGLVQTGDDVMIGGFIVVGQNSQRVIVRGIGPSLPVPGKLANPTLELHNGDGTLAASNDNWRSDQESEIIATTIPPSDDLESAIVRDLSAGNYTAILRGVNNTTGVALVEVYALQ